MLMFWTINKILNLSKFEEGLPINAKNDRHNELLKENRPTDAIDEHIIRAIKALIRKIYDEVR